MNSILKPTILMSFVTLLSKLLGYCRDIIVALLLGSNNVSDLFFAIFRFYGFISVILGYLYVSPPIVRIYTILKNKDNEDESLRFSFNFLLTSLIILFFILLPIIIFSENIIGFFLYNVSNETIKIYSHNLRLLLFCCPLVIIISVLIAILRSKFIFLPVAFLPIILNIVIIIFLSLNDYVNLSINFYFSFCLLGTLFLQILFLIYFAKIKIKISNLPKIQLNPILLGAYKQAFPSITIGLLIFLVNSYVMIAFSSTEGNISYVYYANRVYNILIEIFTLTLGFILLTHLSSLLKSKNYSKINNLIDSCFLFLIFTIMPCTFVIFFYSDIIIQILFERGKFNEFATQITASILKGYSLGIPAMGFAAIMFPCYFANGKFYKLLAITTIYFVLSIILINLSSNYYNINYVGYGLALASWIYAILLSFNSRNEIIKAYNLRMIFQLLKSFVYASIPLILIFIFSFYFTFTDPVNFLIALFIAIITYVIFMLLFEWKSIMKIRSFI
tara:strand:- start:74230 stop:75738 length:1509 start_codon:yes stop_codon:yes gene_type:complete